MLIALNHFALTKFFFFLVWWYWTIVFFYMMAFLTWWYFLTQWYFLTWWYLFTWWYFLTWYFFLTWWYFFDMMLFFDMMVFFWHDAVFWYDIFFDWQYVCHYSILNIMFFDIMLNITLFYICNVFFSTWWFFELKLVLSRCFFSYHQQNERLKIFWQLLMLSKLCLGCELHFWHLQGLSRSRMEKPSSHGSEKCKLKQSFKLCWQNCHYYYEMKKNNCLI